MKPPDRTLDIRDAMVALLTQLTHGRGKPLSEITATSCTQITLTRSTLSQQWLLSCPLSVELEKQKNFL